MESPRPGMVYIDRVMELDFGLGYGKRHPVELS